MAVALSRQFIRNISQPFDYSQTGISVWTYEQVLAKQEAEKVSQPHICFSFDQKKEKRRNLTRLVFGLVFFSEKLRKQ